MGVLAFITVYSVLLVCMLIILIAIYHFSNWRTEAKEIVERESSLFETTNTNNKVYMLKN
jgi:hypothetical protein